MSALYGGHGHFDELLPAEFHVSGEGGEESTFSATTATTVSVTDTGSM